MAIQMSAPTLPKRSAQPSAHAQALVQRSEKAQALNLNWGLRLLFSQFVRVSLRQPSQALFFARTVLWQGRAARLRARLARAEGLQVPPIAIFSIMNRCNPL